MNRLYYIWLIIFFTGTGTFAQDVQFSQFYANPIHLSPAFAGSAHKSRAILHQKVQWPALQARYITSFFSGDTWVQKYRSGFGVYAMQDWQGASHINTSELHMQYAYELPINHEFSIRTGLQVGLMSRTLNGSKLTFGDQYTDDGFADGSISYDAFGKARRQFVNVGSGAMLYSKNLWVGYSAHNMNQPNQSFMGEVSRLPVKHAFVAGYKFVITEAKYNSMDNVKEFCIIPTAHYKFQGRSDQVDLGIYAIYDQIILGFWYRGIPFKKYLPKLQNNESAIAIIGYKFDNLSISYSYDLTVSRLAIARTAGSHELNITYVHENRSRRTRLRKRLPCPTF